MSLEPESMLYREGNWSIELRKRTNHPGSKIWGLYCGNEIFSLDERGLRRRDGCHYTIPESVEKRAYEEWAKIS